MLRTTKIWLQISTCKWSDIPAWFKLKISLVLEQVFKASLATCVYFLWQGNVGYVFRTGERALPIVRKVMVQMHTRGKGFTKEKIGVSFQQKLD